MNDIVYVGKHLRTYSVDEHFHETWELVYCTTGVGEFVFTEGDTIAYKTGFLVIIPSHIRHANNSVKGFTNIHMNIDNAPFTFTSPTCITDNREKHILTACNEIFFYFHSDVNRKSLVISALENLIFSYVIAFQNNRPLSKPTEIIKNNIVNNFPDRNFHLDEYLHSLPFSYDYLRKLFKKEMGVTPHAYLNHMRMQMAEKLLSSTDSEYNITKIALSCGFEEPLYFSRVFKKYYGCSPTHYT